MLAQKIPHVLSYLPFIKGKSDALGYLALVSLNLFPVGSASFLLSSDAENTKRGSSLYGQRDRCHCLLHFGKKLATESPVAEQRQDAACAASVGR